LRELNLHEKPLFPRLKHLVLSDSTFGLSTSLTEGLSPIIPILKHHFPNLITLATPSSDYSEKGHEYHPPWELANIFWEFGPRMANGFYDYMEPEYDGWFEEAEEADEPSIWGDGLDESEGEYESDMSGYSDERMEW
jgi:hypothetical protein